MKKIKLTIVIMFIACIFVIGYIYTSIKSPQEPPEISIIIGDKQLDYVIGKNQWNNAKYDREATFQTYMRKYSASELPYIELGSNVNVHFSKNPPDKITISDILIDETENGLYIEKEIIDIPVALKNGKTSFEVKNHFTSDLSNYYIKDETILRGYKIVATWGENECEYAFIIRTE